MRRRRPDDAGFSLVELIVAIGISTIVLLTLGAVAVGAARVQAAAADHTLSAGAARTVLASVSTSVRQADAVAVTGDGRVLLARVVTADGSARCRGWAFVDDAVRYVDSAGAIDVADVDHWRVLAHGVAPAGDEPAFQARSSRDVDLSVRTVGGAADKSGPVVRTSAFAQSEGREGEGACW